MEKYQQLILLLHAHECEKPDSTNKEVRDECNVDQCQVMKNLLSHIRICDAANACTFQNCVSIKLLILHCISCTQKECETCSPPKQAKVHEQQQPPVVQTSLANQVPNPTVVQQANASLGHSFSSSNHGVRDSGMQNQSLNSSLETEESLLSRVDSTVVSTCPLVNNIGWRQHFTSDLRQHIIKRLVQEILPAIIKDKNDLKRSTIKRATRYARRFEYLMNEAASDKDDYFRLVAGKIYQLQMRAKHLASGDRPKV